MLAASKYDLILCDWHLPGIKGIHVLKEVRKKLGPGVTFVLATSESDQSCVVEAIQSGVPSYIIKPFDTHTLKAKIESARKRAAAAKINE